MRIVIVSYTGEICKGILISDYMIFELNFRNSCDIGEAEPPCYLVEGKGAFYPDCCPRGVCPPSSAGENFL